MRRAKRDFQGEVALITGASAGIGGALAREFARRGAAVALVARRADRLEALADEVRAMGQAATAIAADVTRDGDLERAVAATHEALGAISVAVANAGFGVVGAVEQLTVEDYRRQFETNVFGVLRTVYATLDDLKQTRGRLVVVGSVTGHLSMPGSSPYAMSKFAVRALALALRPELARSGVSVTLVSPGYVESELRRVDNRGVFHPGARDVVPRVLLMKGDTAAHQIVNAAARQRGEVVITLHGKVAVFFQRHTPWLVAAAVRRLGLRARLEPGGAP